MIGMRLGEICELTRASVERDDQGQAFLTVRKTKNGRPMFWPLEGAALALVKKQLKGAPFPASHLFPGPKSGNARSSIRRRFKDAVLAAATKHPKMRLVWGESRSGITFHTLRHTMASLGINDGLTVNELADLGNWKDTRMLRRYARFSNARLRKAASRVANIVGALSHSVTIASAAPERQKAASQKN
jgi:integrase